MLQREKVRVFEFVLVCQKKNDQTKEPVGYPTLVGPKAVLAPTADAVVLIAAPFIPSGFSAELGEVEVVVRPFRACGEWQR